MLRPFLMSFPRTVGATAITLAPDRKVVRVKPTGFAQFNSASVAADIRRPLSPYIHHEEFMNKVAAVFFLLLTSITSAQTSAPDAKLSPAERSIASANKVILARPTQSSGYNQLAIALARRARETSDSRFYSAAEDALKKSFEQSPGNVEGEKIHVWLLLGRHEFPAALESAKLLNQKAPDDVLTYGFLVDANAELGKYTDAEKAAQHMLD